MANVFAEMEGLKRRRALIEALGKQNMETPIQGDTGIGQLLAKLGTTWLTQSAGKDLDREQAGLDQQYQQGLGSEVANFMKQSQGTPGETMNLGAVENLMLRDQAPPSMAEPVQPDPLGAVTAAMTSRYPEMQGIGKTALPFMMPKPKDDQLYQVGPGGRLVTKSGQVVAESPFKPDKPNLPKWQEEGYNSLEAWIAAQERIRRAGKSDTNIDIKLPAAEKKFDERFGTEEGKRLSEGLGARSGQIEAITATQRGRDLLDEGIYSGFGANWKTLGNKALAQLNLMEPDKAARTEQFLAHVGDIVIPRLKDFGGNDTVEEMKYLQRVLAGDVTLEEQTLRKVLESAENKVRARIMETDKSVGRWSEAGKEGVPTIPSLTPVPGPWQSKKPPPPSGGKPAQAVAPAGAPSAQAPLTPAERARLEELRRRKAGVQ